MPVTQFDTKERYRYQNGFDNHLEYGVFYPWIEGYHQANGDADPRP
jgi:hypothetical protein